MRVEMDSSVVTDPRFKLLAKMLDISFREVIGTCFLVWLVCYERNTDRLFEKEIAIAAENSDFASAIVDVGLAHRDIDPKTSLPVIVIHGAAQRVGVHKSVFQSLSDNLKTRSKRSAPPPEQFLVFWKLWPRKVAREAAIKAWISISPTPELQAIILEAVAKQSKSQEWIKDGGKFIPHAATWLNGKRWEDELKPTLNGQDETADEWVKKRYGKTFEEISGANGSSAAV